MISLTRLGHRVHEAVAVGLLGRETVTGQGQFQCLLVRNPLGQAQQSASTCDQPSLDLRDTELRFGRRDHQVGGKHEFRAACQREALDRRNDRLTRRPFRESETASRHEYVLAGHECLQIHTGTEVSAGPCQHRQGQIVVRIELFDRSGQCVTDRRVDGVTRLGPVDGDDQCPPAPLGENLVRHDVPLVCRPRSRDYATLRSTIRTKPSGSICAVS